MAFFFLIIFAHMTGRICLPIHGQKILPLMPSLGISFGIHSHLNTRSVNKTLNVYMGEFSNLSPCVM